MPLPCPDRRITRSATRPVQPVWCDAPRPAPSSPWKYSWKSSASRHAGSVRKRSCPPNTGRVPSSRGRKIATRRSARSIVISSQRVLVSRPGRELDGEVVVQALAEAQQRPDDEVVDREPDRPAPVGVAAEEAGGGLRRLVVDDRLGAGLGEDVRPPAVLGRQGADPVRRQERVRVGEVLEDERQAVVAHEREHRGAPVLADAHRRCVLGPRVEEADHPLAELGEAPVTAGLPMATAQNGMRPVIDRTRTGTLVPSGRRTRS